MNNSNSPRDRSLSELLSDFTRESFQLVRQEIELAKLEIVQNIGGLKTGAVSMAIALPLLFAGFLVCLGAGVLGLDLAIQRLWLSALIVGLGVMLIGGLALLGGRSRVSEQAITPQRSADSLRNDKEMLQEHIAG